MEGAKENASWREPWSGSPVITRHSVKASLRSGWEVNLWVRANKVPIQASHSGYISSDEFGYAGEMPEIWFSECGEFNTKLSIIYFNIFSDSSICVICPWSVLLSAEGNLFFQNNASQAEAAPFSPPELLHRPSKNQHFGLTKVRDIAKCILTAPHEDKLMGFNATYQAPTVTSHF